MAPQLGDEKLDHLVMPRRSSWLHNISWAQVAFITSTFSLLIFVWKKISTPLHSIDAVVLPQHTLKHLWPSPSQHASTRGKDPYLRDATSPWGAPVKAPGRHTDTLDAFRDYKKGNVSECDFSSLDLHTPFHPLCQDRQQLLTAMSNGGRIGIDAPYAPQGCDMRWFTNDEICEILSRFSQVFMIGDSMVRASALAMHLILRRDMDRGANTNWTPDPEGYDCGCNRAFESRACGFNGVFSTSYVLNSDPTSLYCPINSTAKVQTHIETQYPLSDDVLKGLHDELPKERPDKPIVFIYGTGGWNNFNSTASKGWTEQVESTILKALPYLNETKASDGVTPQFWPRLFVTPNAAGPNKPAGYMLEQGNHKVMAFELEMGRWIRDDIKGGMEHLGIYNMTAQNTSPDGTHAGMRSNIIKAMMMLNWLSLLDTSPYYEMAKA